MMAAWQKEPFVLASASPRRRELLSEAGYQFLIDPADIDEQDVPPQYTPAETAEYLAVRKAQTVSTRHAGQWVLGADTVVSVGSSMLGKPTDAADARRMLRLLSGVCNQVISGVALVRDSQVLSSTSITSTVQMRVLSSDELERYIQSGLWEGKAGGYGIQGPEPFVTRMEGSLTNIVGLPMEEVTRQFELHGIFPRGRDGT